MKKKWVLLCLAGMMLYSQPAMATPFPDKTDEVIQDTGNYTQKNDRQKITEALKQLPGSYKIIVVESTQPEAESPDEYAQRLFDNYNLPDEYLMVVLDITREQLGVYPGPELQSQGADLTMLHDKITAYFDPFKNQREYLAGIQTFLGEVEAELHRKQTSGKPADTPKAEDPAKEELQSTSGLPQLPWWLYAAGAGFAALAGALIYAMIRRRAIFHQVDDVEDWKDELIEKINVIEVDKQLRRSTGKTEENYLMLADRKENLLRNRMPDVDMMILDAEEACDRFRFKLALGLLEEARESLTAIEQELHELKSDTTKVVAKKKESKLAIPEIGKQLEQVERRLSDLRLEYGLTFHELKAGLDEVEVMRSKIKELRAAGDDNTAYDMTLKAQKILGDISMAIEKTPQWRDRVLKEIPEELRQLEEGISQVVGDGYDRDQHTWSNALLQAKQLMLAAKAALEEGNLKMLETHVQAFEVLIDSTYQSMEEMVLAQREAAGSAEPATAVNESPDKTTGSETDSVESFSTGALERMETVDDAPMQGLSEESAAAHPTGIEADDAEKLETERLETGVFETERREAERLRTERLGLARMEAPGAMTTATVVASSLQEEDVMAAAGWKRDSSISLQEREELLQTNGKAKTVAESPAPVPASAYDQEAEEDDEYELVIPKINRGQEEPEEEEIQQAERLDIRTEDEALDELERISQTLVRVRQQIKRSYLPGLPDQLKYLFEDIVQTLGQIKAVMESYRYDIEEVAMLINDANDLLIETEQLAERTISACQLAEGAIQYTNRYRRQNRQVNELLTRAEQSFRQLMFSEAYQLAEEARLMIEDAPEEPETGWLLRRKKKG
ncbi:septation ring formation regulator EzrA [Brevibacillus ruminantium]|uniref:Septation ring formation regulator EzrA n=1 Tax=Brevibacillus ruminantium TaxID=2950604 RepID=A0ABY4WJE7_9BACL|nr:septation ring formation regulator EzrA [Brevibacillus ruminantium]USG67207.1 septation ring formation regulator EzrA [Brevibacillus ruminantium]